MTLILAFLLILICSLPLSRAVPLWLSRWMWLSWSKREEDVGLVEEDGAGDTAARSDGLGDLVDE
jgi:hypothetical protein